MNWAWISQALSAAGFSLLAGAGAGVMGVLLPSCVPLVVTEKGLTKAFSLLLAVVFAVLGCASTLSALLLHLDASPQLCFQFGSGVSALLLLCFTVSDYM